MCKTPVGPFFFQLPNDAFVFLFCLSCAALEPLIQPVLTAIADPITGILLHNKLALLPGILFFIPDHKGGGIQL